VKSEKKLLFSSLSVRKTSLIFYLLSRISDFSKGKSDAICRECVYRESVAYLSEARNHTDANGCDDGFMPEFLAHMHVRHMHLDAGQLHRGKRVPYRYTVMRIRPGVENNPAIHAASGVQPVYYFALVIGLEIVKLEAKLYGVGARLVDNA